VRTPTDIIGQHIHLPKWDLTTNDGAANGWNYEDGALAPGMVQERIAAINHFNELASGEKPFDGTLVGAVVAALGLEKALEKVHPVVLETLTDAGTVYDISDLAPVATIDTGDPGGTPAGLTHLAAAEHPFFGAGVGGQDHLGARTVIQRLLMDPVVNVAGVDRGLGLTFSHDHYGPSTFQQIGLYSTILAEPAGSTWVHNESGQPLGWAANNADDIDGYRNDGGPTSWQAAILTPELAPFGSTVGSENLPAHREFYFEMSDFQHAYEKGVYIGANENGVNLHTDIVQPNPFNVVQAEVADGEALADSWRLTVNPSLKVPAVGALDGAVDAGGPNVVKAEPNCPGDGVPVVIPDPANPNVDIVNIATVKRPCAEAINIAHGSTWVTNYRNEPIGLRVFDPNKIGPDLKQGAQADGKAGDLAFALASRQDRAISQLNTSFGDMPAGYRTPATYCQGSNGDGINCDRRPGDPITPIMRTFQNDQVKIKIQVGATEEQHQATVHGMKWLSNGSAFGRSGNSGWRNFQSTGISEQFSLQVPIHPDPQQRGNTVDYLYANDATRPGMWLGTWGILRSYGQNRSDLYELPGNPMRDDTRFTNQRDFNGVCPKDAPVKQFDVFAVLANDALPNNLDVDIVPDQTIEDPFPVPFTASVLPDPDGGTLVYNRRGTVVPTANVPGITATGGAGPLNDPTAMMYVLLEDLEPRFIPGESPDGTEGADDSTTKPYAANGVDDRCERFKKNGKPNENLWGAGCPVKLKDTAPVEPLVLRAEAGDCIETTLHNKMIAQAKVTSSGLPVLTGTGKAIFDEARAQKAIDNNEGLVDSQGSPVAYDDISFDIIPDLAGWQDMMWAVNRELGNPGIDEFGNIIPQGGAGARGNEMTFFNNNLVRPSAFVGLHPQLVEYDASRDDGVLVGNNQQDTLAGPGGQASYRWYAGDLQHDLVSVTSRRRNAALVATPIEFGASNLLSADRIKQPQKGLFGALSILPKDSIVDASTMVPDGQGSGTDTRKTRAQVTVTSPAGDAGSGGTFREALSIGHKIANLRWKDGTAIKNVNQEELGREGAEDSGHAGFNYGMEPPWFRFQVPPNVPFGNAGTPDTYGAIPNAHAMYANPLVANATHPNFIPEITVDGVKVSEAGDPQTPVFRATAGEPARMHVLNGASADRDGTFILHGHLWQRDPFVCTGAADGGSTSNSPQDNEVALAGRCDPDALAPSNALGLNPQGKWMASEEGMGHTYAHWPILLESAGGSNAVAGDYLYRDYSPSGNRNGQFGILRVE
jgi:hypothetical protein